MRMGVHWMDDAAFMRMAIAEARRGLERGQEPFGACIVRDGEVVSLAHNTVLDTKDVTAHAEMNAIREACRRLNAFDLSGCVIYATCEPCPMCRTACERANISRIVYGVRLDDVRRRAVRPPVQMIGGLLRDENLELIKQWSVVVEDNPR